MEKMYDVIVTGAGQAGLATAYYLRRAQLDFILLDAEPDPGGAWRHTWDSLHLFSPAAFSSLPGWMMPTADSQKFPSRDEVIDYLTRYEERYQFPIERPVKINQVTDCQDYLTVSDGEQQWHARAVVSATGTWGNTYVPDYPDQDIYRGEQLHSAYYHSPEAYAGKRVLIVGGGNSGAQILAEVSQVADAIWVTQREPVFLPDDVDGRVLFERASARILAPDSDKTPIGGIGDIVMVPPVKDARARGVLHSVRPFERFTERGVVWRDGKQQMADAVIWCTGFRPAINHLAGLGVVQTNGRVETLNNQSIHHPRLWLAGYGDWTGAASATLIGAGRVAREMVPRLKQFLVSV
jgi:Predicted flavoprotein involved in K+ transport